MRARPLAAVLLLLAATSAGALPLKESKSSQYYTITTFTDCPEVPDLLKFADAAWSRLSAHFGKRPSGGKLEIEYFPEQTGMTDKMRSDGFPDESYGSEGRFWNFNKKVYARRLDFDWDTRRALMINLVDQFQTLSVQAKGKGCPTWYRAGLAAHFAIHRWDGKTLTVGEEDEPTPWGREIAKNFKLAKEKGLDVTDAVRSNAASYLECWPFVHWSLASGDRGAYGRFRAAEKKMWDGMEPAEAKDLVLGSDPKKVRAAAQDWFAGLESTWVAKMDLWERTAEDGFAALPRPNPSALLVTGADEGDAPFIEATVTPGSGAAGGLALHVGDTLAFTAVSWKPGGALELRRHLSPDNSEKLESCEGPAGPEARIRLEADAAGVLRVSVDGKQVLAHEPADAALLGKGKAGLLAEGGPVRFSGVKTSGVKTKKK